MPEVVAVSDEDPTFLVLEWIDEGRLAPTSDASLGTGLAALHRAGAPSFGRADRRSTGSRGLPNEPCATWSEFYATNRLLPLARLAREAGAIPGAAIEAMEQLAGRLDDAGGADEPPARLHGDLWSGNRLIGSDGANWLIDPAAHGGHREFDLAMMRLFGGFGADCFDAYEAAWPLSDGWAARIPLHQIAPLVVHAIKFGGAYVAAAERAIERAGRILTREARHVGSRRGMMTRTSPRADRTRHMEIHLTVNGVEHTSEVEPRTLLVHHLREGLGLTGTNVGCDTTSCGACTVHLDGESVKSCTVLAVQADGHEITTIEGLAQDGQLHPMQAAFQEHHGLQCGYCTPGMVMAAVSLLEEQPDADEAAVRQGLEGNLCRCTGYQNIVAAVLSCSKGVPA